MNNQHDSFDHHEGRHQSSVGERGRSCGYRGSGLEYNSDVGRSCGYRGSGLPDSCYSKSKGKERHRYSWGESSSSTEIISDEELPYEPTNQKKKFMANFGKSRPARIMNEINFGREFCGRGNKVHRENAFAFDFFRTGGTTAYYDKFPPPWNKHPRKVGRKGGSNTVQNLMVGKNIVTKFEGTSAEEYIRWRAQTISYTHSSDVDLQTKLTVLLSTIADEVLKSLSRPVNYSARGYLNLIIALEKSTGETKDF